MLLGKPIDPPNQLLHVGSLRRQLARGVFGGNVVRLHQQHLSPQSLGAHGADTPHAQQLAP
eukprot:5238385-Prymnesium_polylepis.1